MLVFDTTILIDALHRREAALRKIVELEEMGRSICTAEFKSQGRSIGDFDELIAAISMTNGTAIVSRDHHFQHIPGLRNISY